MRSKLYAVKLSPPQQQQLQDLTRKGNATPRIVKRARILLLAHENVSDAEIITRVEISASTIANIRRRFQTEPLDDLLFEKARPGRAPKFDGIARAKITALACTTPPKGFGQWSYRLLADRVVELGFVDAIHFDTIGEILKKTSFNRNASAVGA